MRERLHQTLDRIGSEWSAGYRPPRSTITHDALYRVAAVDFEYKDATGTFTGSDAATDWRTNRTFHKNADPMREAPAPIAHATASARIITINYEHDWLANMTAWAADNGKEFYERSIGRNDTTHAGITNGFDEGNRPSALEVATNLPTSPVSGSGERGGWLELTYGESGNVETMTVRAQCYNSGGGGNRCYDELSATRLNRFRQKCVCQVEQHYQYRWDELNRIAEARRYDRGGSGSFTFAVRQRYRYDGANVRTVKETFDEGSTSDRTALYVYPGAYERTGVERDITNTKYATHTSHNTESQYSIAGARIVWKTPPTPYDLDADARITYALKDLLGSTSAVIDLWSGELLEVSTWHPNGAQETLLNQTDAAMQQEPLGFTGKEADDEVGVVYFGERYLIPRIGRWASPDPLHVHAAGGGEALNSFHYIGGNLLEARDPKGMDYTLRVAQAPDGTEERVIHVGILVVAGNRQSANAPQPAVTRQDLENSASEIRQAMEQSYVSFEQDGVRYRFEIDVQVSDTDRPVENQRSTSLEQAGPGTRTATAALDEAADRGLENIAVINPTLAGENSATTRADGDVPEPAENGLLSHPGDTMLVERGAAPRTYAHEGAHLLGLGHLDAAGNVTDSEPQRLQADRAAGLDAPLASRDARALSGDDRARIHEAAQNALQSQSVQLPVTEISGQTRADE